MTAEELHRLDSEPSDERSAILALWHAAQGGWDIAHGIAQDDASREGSWVHAYLHRQEGDISNARYWYSRAGQPEFQGSLDDEWMHIARALLSRAA